MNVDAATAVAYAASGLEVFPLASRSKVPLFECPISRRLRLAKSTDRCRGGCGNDGHGVLDATTDLEKVAAWWSAHPDANIGGAVPEGVFVLDVDPRHDGHRSLAHLISEHGPLPATLRARSGGPDQGTHLWWRHPGGKLRVPKDLPGLDLRVRGNYLVLPPSVHPSGGVYAWINTAIPVADPPAWLVEALRPPVVAHPPKARRLASVGGDSVADWFTASTSWWDVLGRHGWQALDADGTRWRHPAATSALSATVTNDCLFVYSTNTPFEPTGAGDVHGYTRFRAWAVLDHAGDLSAAARAARQLRQEGRAA